MTILSHIILPDDEQLPRRDLYYRPEGTVKLKENALYLDAGSKVRFNTYFNGFFYPKYRRYTMVSSLTACVSLTGHAMVRLICQKGDSAWSLSEIETSAERREYGMPVCQLHALPDEGALFLEVEAVGSGAVFYGGRFETDEQPLHQVKVAVVICTFRREKYIKRNLERLKRDFFEKDHCPAKDDAEVFIIDNGGTLPKYDTSYIRVFPNRNCGGSGGFTRGLIEAYRRRDIYTHVLFMDDDISFEIESLVKTIQILKFARTLRRPLCIGGQMLIEDNPAIQFEAGACYQNGRLVPVNRGLDLSCWGNVLYNETERYVQYNAWWYCCFPLNVVDEVGLPLPLFIKTDDVEYGLRVHPYVMLMDGIGVWHMSFGDKYSTYLEYYIKRNELVVSALHNSGNGALKSIWKLARAMAKSVLIGDTSAAKYILQAGNDFLEGPEFFLRTDGERLHLEIMGRKPAPDKIRLRAIINAGVQFVPVSLKIIYKYGKMQKLYKARLPELTNMTFWRNYLKLEEEG